jgi:protein TonB
MCMAPKVDPADLPAGPDADASAASAATAEQKQLVKDAALLRAETTDTDDPERTAAPDKTPVEDEHATAKTPTPAASPAVAAEATAMPSAEIAAAAQRSGAPQPGSADSLRRLRTTWQKELAAHIDKYKRYPADRANKGAEIVLRFALDRMGHVLAIGLVRSSGDTSFDDAALAMIKRADPLPPPPPQVADEGLTFTMPVDFRARTAHR